MSTRIRRRQLSSREEQSCHQHFTSGVMSIWEITLIQKKWNLMWRSGRKRLDKGKWNGEHWKISLKTTIKMIFMQSLMYLTSLSKILLVVFFGFPAKFWIYFILHFPRLQFWNMKKGKRGLFAVAWLSMVCFKCSFRNAIYRSVYIIIR